MAKNEPTPRDTNDAEPKPGQDGNRKMSGIPKRHGKGNGNAAVKVEVRAGSVDGAKASNANASKPGSKAGQGSAGGWWGTKPMYWYAVGGLFVLTVVFWGIVVFSGKKTSSPAATPDTVAQGALGGVNLLNGVPMDPNDVGAWPVAMMFDNHPSARPPVGVSKARIMYETFVEGGTTRLMGIFDDYPGLENIGPIRSARHYFVEIAEQYQAAYVHAGQSPQASAALDASKVVKDVNLIGSGAKYGHRESDRPAPHNLFTDATRMTYMKKDKHILAERVQLETLTFAPEPALGDRPTTPLSITVNFSNLSYQVDFKYHREKNAFERYLAGNLHVDAATNEVLSPKTVAIVKVPPETALVEKGRIDFDVSGEGDAMVFFNGKQVNGTFKQPTIQDRMRFYGPDGAELALPPGLIWIIILPGDRTVTVEGGQPADATADQTIETNATQ